MEENFFINSFSCAFSYFLIDISNFLSFKSTFITALRDVIFLIPLAIIFGLNGGVDLFLWSAPVADLLGFIVAISFLIPALKKLNSYENAYEVKECEDSVNLIVESETL